MTRYAEYAVAADCLSPPLLFLFLEQQVTNFKIDYVGSSLVVGFGSSDILLC